MYSNALVRVFFVKIFTLNKKDNALALSHFVKI